MRSTTTATLKRLSTKKGISGRVIRGFRSTVRVRGDVPAVSGIRVTYRRPSGLTCVEFCPDQLTVVTLHSDMDHLPSTHINWLDPLSEWCTPHSAGHRNSSPLRSLRLSSCYLEMAPSCLASNILCTLSLSLSLHHRSSGSVYVPHAGCVHIGHA